MISEAAVLAAAKASYEHVRPRMGFPSPFEEAPEPIRQTYIDMSRVALEVAVPLLQADIRADIISNPKEKELDDYTIGELALEAKSKSSSLRDKNDEELSPSLEEVTYLLTNERSIEAAARAGCEFRMFAQWDTMSSGEQQMYKGKTAYMLSSAVPYLKGAEITKEAVEVAAKTKADLFTGEGSWADYHPVTKAQYRKEVEASLKAAINAAK